jgi:hypothetical protein
MTRRSWISRVATAFVVLGSCAIAAPVAVAAPSPSMDTPVSGSTTNDATPMYAGQAGDAIDDSPDVTVRIYSGADTSGESVQTLTASRSGTAWSVEGSPALPDGVYTARAEQSDVLNDVGSSGPVTFAIDTTPPDTAVASGPSAATNDSTPEFRFDSAEAGRFACRLYSEGGSASSAPFDCASPYTAQPLADGAYVFEVAAIDSAGNQDPSPSSRSFSVDTLAPETNITVGPGQTTADTAAFVFSSDDADGFECRLDSAGWEACVSPKSYSGVTVGAHTFEVRASDAAGNLESTPPAWSWRVVAAGGASPGSGGTPPGSGGTTVRSIETIPAVEKQAVALAEDIVRIRKAISHTPLRRLRRKHVLRLNGLDAVTAGKLDFRATARVRPRRGHYRRVPLLVALREVPAAGTYSLKARLTKQGRRLVRRHVQLLVDLRLGFTDRAGRSLLAKSAATVGR